MVNGGQKELKTCSTPDNTEEEPVEEAQEPGESLSRKCDVVNNDECYLNVNDVGDQPDSTDPTE